MSNHKSGRDRDIDPGLFRACRQADANRGQTAEAVYALKPRQVIGHCDFKFEYRHLGRLGPPVFRLPAKPFLNVTMTLWRHKKRIEARP
jgi:hypothetical protein